MPTTVNVKNKVRAYSVDMNFGENLDEAIALFGAEVVYDLFIDGAKLKTNARVRQCFDKDMSDEQIAEILSIFKLGTRGPRTSGPRDPKKRILANFANLSAADKADLIRSLQEQLTQLQQQAGQQAGQ